MTRPPRRAPDAMVAPALPAARPPEVSPLAAALRAIAHLTPAQQLAVARRRLVGRAGGPLAAFEPGEERDGAEAPGRIDGRLLEAICARALEGAGGAVFTPPAEARLLAGFGLAHAAAARGGPVAADGLAILLGAAPTGTAADRARTRATLSAALDGLAVLDPTCGGGALLAAAALLAAPLGARLELHGLDLSPLAATATRARLERLGAPARVRTGDALTAPWPACGLLLANPPFLRHEAIPTAQKAAAVAASGLSRQADLSAHLALLSLRRAPVAALVLPRALLTARSAEPLLEEARIRGGFALRLRSRAAGSFAASVDTLLAVWVAGGADAPAAEASVPLAALTPAEVLALARGRATTRIARARPAASSRRSGRAEDAVPLSGICDVRFGLKSGCNAFFHLEPILHGRCREPISRDGSAGGRFRSPLLGEVALEPGDVAPLLASLKEARAPERLEPRLALLRPVGEPSAAARAYLEAGERAGVHQRPTCAARHPWWRIVPGRAPAPLLYPAKVGARAFAVLNEGALLEDKKWHALFPRGVEPWALGLVLSASSVRLSIEERARQLTGAQAIADVDCRVLAATPVPPAAALAPRLTELGALRSALGRDEVTTDLAAMLARPAQRALDLLVGEAMGLGRGEVERHRRALLARVADRLEHAAAVRGLVAGRG